MDFMKIMKQAKAMQEQMAGMQDDLSTLEVVGTSAAGMVTVTLNGKGDMRGITIDPSLMKDDEKEILEDLIVAAHTDAKSKSEAAMQEKMQGLTDGMGLPAGFKMPGM